MKSSFCLRQAAFLFFFQLAFLLALQSSYGGSATWNLNPASGIWGVANNWTPPTVPNGPADTATFATSNNSAVSVIANTEVNGIIFNPGASPFSIITKANTNTIITLTVSGTGITNNSGIEQNFVANANGLKLGYINFTNSATAGSETVYTANTNPTVGASAFIIFDDTSSAGSATLVTGEPIGGVGAGGVEFRNSSTAENATFVNDGVVIFYDTSTAANATFSNNRGIFFGGIHFLGDSTAGNAIFANAGEVKFEGENPTAANGTFVSEGGDDQNPSGAVVAFIGGNAGTATFIFKGGRSAGAIGGIANFQSSGSAANGIFTMEGGTVDGALGAMGSFIDTSTADNATFTLNGGAVAGAGGAMLEFTSDGNGSSNCTAGNATLIANGGTGGGAGGAIRFRNNSLGGTSRIEVFGNANLDISDRDRFTKVTIGSLEGDGLVFLGSNTLKIGGNNLDTTFSGIAQDGGGVGGGTHGALTKSGTGTLTLSGPNTYSGNTGVFRGTLLVSNVTGSGTGTGPVTVTGGTLGGIGIIAGAVTVGTGSGGGAFLAPAAGTSRKATLTFQSSLTLQVDGTYIYTFKARQSSVRTDLVIANGVTINNATIAISGTTQNPLTIGTVLTVISNTSANPISGTFSNLADGAVVTINGNNLQADYQGGDGNDLTLTVVP